MRLCYFGNRNSLNYLLIEKCIKDPKVKNVTIALKGYMGIFISTKILLRGDHCEAYHHEWVMVDEINYMSAAIVPYW